MADLIGSLVVTLGLDPANFTKGQKEAANALLKTQQQASRTAKEMQGDGAKAAEFFGSIKTEALSLIGVLLGGRGIEAFVKGQTKSLADLGRAAQHVGDSVPHLAAFEMAIARNGGSAEAAGASLIGLTDAMESYRLHADSPLAPFFNNLGIERADSAMTAYEKFAKFAETHANDVPLINLMGHGIGLDQGTIDATVQMKTLAKFRQEMAQSLEIGVPTPEMTQRATDFQHALVGLGQAAEHDGDMLLNKMYPGLTKVTDGMRVFIEQNPAALAQLSIFGGWLVVIAGLNFKSVLGFLATAAPFLGLLGFTGQAGGTNDAEQIDAAKAQHEKYLAEHPEYKDPWDRMHGWWHKNMPTWLGGGGNPPLADKTMTPEQQNFLKSLSAPESSGDYSIKNGGSHFSDFSKFPEGVAPGGTSSAAGRYQFTSDTWKDVSRALGLHDFSPASQDRGAWYLAQREYRAKTGRDLQSDLASGGHGSDIATALNGRWPSLPGGSEYRGKALLSPKLEPSSSSGSGWEGHVPPGWGAGHLNDTGHAAWPAAMMATAAGRAAAAKAEAADRAAQAAGHKQYHLGAAVPRLPPPPRPPAPSGSPDGKNMTIGSITIHSQATDAKGIARDMHTALIDQANRGLS